MPLNLDKQHVVLYCALAGCFVGGTYLVEAHRADTAEQKASVAQGLADAAQKQNQQFQLQVQQQLQQLASQNQQLALQNAQLTAAITQRDTVLKQTQAVIPSLSQDEVAKEITSNLNLAPTDITASPDGSYVTSRSAANAILGSVEQEHAEAQDLIDANKQIANDQMVIANDAKELEVQKQGQASEEKASAASLAACNAEVVAVKKQARKNIIKTIFTALGIGIGIGAKL